LLNLKFLRLRRGKRFRTVPLSDFLTISRCGPDDPMTSIQVPRYLYFCSTGGKFVYFDYKEVFKMYNDLAKCSKCMKFWQTTDL
jgi:hypothetical protein